MSKQELFESISKQGIEWAIKKLWPGLISVIIASVIYISPVKNKLIEHPNVLLVLLTIVTATTVLFLILWIRIYWRNEWLTPAFGVSWDKKYNMRCANCKKVLKNSTSSEHIFYCPDKTKCKDAKYMLRDENGKGLTEQEAKDLLIKRKMELI